MSIVAAIGNVTSMALVGPMAVLAMRRLGWTNRRMLVTALLGWTALFVAQIVMAGVFGYAAGFPGFKFIQPLTLPLSFGNFLASMWLTKQSKQDRRSDANTARHRLHG